MSAVMRERTEHGGYRVPTDAYDQQWIARVKSRIKVDENGCWVWQGWKQRFRNQKPGQPGYGGTNYRGKGVRVHRKMLELKLGHPLPPELHACHTCDNPPCCNPDHLYAATNKQNHIDGGKRGRMQGQWKTHCKRGHALTPDNLAKRGNGAPWRYCKTCDEARRKSPKFIAWRREYQRKRRELKRALKATEQSSAPANQLALNEPVPPAPGSVAGAESLPFFKEEPPGNGPLVDGTVTCPNHGVLMAFGDSCWECEKEQDRD